MARMNVLPQALMGAWVWGAAANDVWLVGHEGAGNTPKLYRWSGSALAAVAAPWLLSMLLKR
jgi:hypothetical protein